MGLAALLSAGMITRVSADEGWDLALNWPWLWSALDSLAAVQGVTRDQFRVDPATLDLAGGYPDRLPLHRYVMAEPLRSPALLEDRGRLLTRGDLKPSRCLWDMAMASAADPRPSADDLMVGSPPAETHDPPVLVDVIELLYRGSGKRLQGREREQIVREGERLGSSTALRLASLIRAVAGAVEARDDLVDRSELASGGLLGGKSRRTAEVLRVHLAETAEPRTRPSRARSDMRKAFERFDRDGLARGAVALATAMERAQAAMPAPDARDFQIEWTTPRGRVAVGGTGPNRYRGAYLLVFDLGGNDTFEGPGAVSGEDPVSVVVDLGGDDCYAPVDSGMVGPGGAILGYAAVMDLARGNDHYVGERWACGFGFLGVGWIYDEGGNDTYTMRGWGEGAAAFGMGLLADSAGDDRYELRGVHGREGVAADHPGWGQGFGGPGGAGLLVDLSGADEYLSCAQAARSDSTPGLSGAAPCVFTQGAASGDWMAGGIGILLDASGDDTYTAATHAQGAAANAGLGVLIDLRGRDRYTCAAQAQGFGENQGAGLLVDAAGEDAYRIAATPGFAMGYGGNLGLGVLADGAGADTLRAPHMCLGVSEGQGAGFALDCGGRNVYSCDTPFNFGVVDSDSRGHFQTLVPGVALFVSLETGVDTLPEIGERVRAQIGRGPSSFRSGVCNRRGGVYVGGPVLLPVFVPRCDCQEMNR